MPRTKFTEDQAKDADYLSEQEFADSKSDANPQPLGTASPGTSPSISREDHVHPLPEELVAGKKFSFVFDTDESKPYFEKYGSSWQVACSFRFPGTDVIGTPTGLKVIARKNAPGASFDIRLLDYTNVAVLASISESNSQTVKQVYSTTSFSNLPAGEAILEIQGKESGSGRLEIHAVELLFE